MGPITGRSAGYCAGYPVPGYANPVLRAGVGFGCGFGRGGRGWRNWYYATGLTGWQRAMYPYPAYAPTIPAMTKQQEMEVLKNQAEYLEKSLGEIRKRLDELESQAGK